MPSYTTPAQIRSYNRANFAGPGLKLEVDANATQLGALFLRLRKEQVPFATAAALTRVAYEARDKVRGQLKRSFTLRNERVKQGIQVNRAEKTDWPKCASEVGTLDQFMVLHVTGGQKRPEKGAHSIAIPTRIVERTGSGAVKASEKPFPLRERRTVFVGGQGNQRFIRENTEAKTQRVVVGGKRTTQPSRIANLGFATWYLLRPSVRIKPRWPIVDQVNDVVRDNFPAHFDKEFEAACRSARAQFGHFTSEQGRAFYLRARRALG